MRMFYAIIFRLRCKNPKLYIFSVWIMDQSKNTFDEQENEEASLTETVCDQYKMFLDHINGLKPSLLKTQLSKLLYPLYVHLFLHLLRQNKCSKYAQEFLEKFHFIAIKRPQEIKIMRHSSTATEVICHFQFKSYKKGSIGIEYTKSNYGHLQKWLESNQPLIISKLLKENFHTEILNERLGKADPIIPPKVKARSEKNIMLDELIISRKRPPDVEIAYESSEEPYQDESNIENFDTISSVTSGSKESCHYEANIEDFDDISSVTSGSEASDSEESSNTNVDELSATTSNAIVCSKTYMEDPSSTEVDLPTKTSIMNGTETPDIEELTQMDVDGFSTEVTVTNGSKTPDIEELNQMNVDSFSTEVTVTNDTKTLDIEELKQINVDDFSTEVTITNGTETPDIEELNQMNVDGFSTEVTVTNECSKTSDTEKQSNIDFNNVPIATPITNGFEISDTEELNVETDDLHTEVTVANGVPFSFAKSRKKLVNGQSNVFYFGIAGSSSEPEGNSESDSSLLDDSMDSSKSVTQNRDSMDNNKSMTEKEGVVEKPSFLSCNGVTGKASFSPCNGVNYSSNSTFGQEMFTMRNCQVLLHRLNDVKGTFSIKNSTNNLGSMPVISPFHIRPPIRKNSLDIDISVTEKEESLNQVKSPMTEEAIPRIESYSKDTSEVPTSSMHENNGENYSNNSTFGQEKFIMRNCQVLLHRLNDVKGTFSIKKSTNNLEPLPNISPSHIRPPIRKRKYTSEENGTATTEECKSINSSNSTFGQEKFTMRNCQVLLHRLNEVKGTFSIKDSTSNLESMPKISSCICPPIRKKPHNDWNGVVGNSNTLCNGFADSSNSLDIDIPVTEKEESLSEVESPLTEEAMPRIESYSKDISDVSTSSIHEDNDSLDIDKSVTEKEAMPRIESYSKDTSEVPTSSIHDDNGSPCASGIPTRKVKKGRLKVCAPCLVKKAMTSDLGNPSDEMQSTEDVENLTDKHTKNLLKAICLLDPVENKTSFENLVSNKKSCLPSSKVNESYELEKILEKCKIQSNESPFTPTEVPPIRVLNIESDDNLHCSVIAKDLSYVACAFEKSMYIWRCMEKFPKKYYLSTKHMQLSKGNAFVPKKERVGGVSASPQTPYSGSLRCLACNPLTNTFLLGCESTIECWCPMENKCLSTFKCHTDQVNNICFRPNSTDFISTSMDKRAIVWDYETSIPKCLFSHNDAVKLATAHPKCPYLVTATSREIHLWTEGSPSSQSVCKDHTADITGIAFSPGGDQLASCDKSGLVNVWDMNKRQRFNSFSVTKNGVGNLCYNYSVENTVLATAGLDNTLRLYSGGNSSNTAQQRIPIFIAECRKSSTLNSIQFSNTDELVEVTHTLKKSHEKHPKPLS